MCEIPNLINFFESDIRIAVVYNMSILWGGGGGRLLTFIFACYNEALKNLTLHIMQIGI